MRRLLFGIGWAALLFWLFGSAAEADPPPAHQFISQYDGPQTCAMCHPQAPAQVARSVHYQQKAPAGPNVPGQQGQMVGMLESY